MTTEEKIAQLENNCKAMTEELEKLKVELAEKNEASWTPKKGEEYLCVCNNGRIVSQIYNPSSIFDTEIINMNAKFKPVVGCEEHLKWYRDNVLRVQNKLMQLHELLCPDYFPDWNDNNKFKFYIYYDSDKNTWNYDYDSWSIFNEFIVYFNKEAAEKACEILNREKFMMKG